MGLKTFLIIHTVICLIFGLLCTAIPTIFEPLYGIVLNPVGEILARWLGAALIGLGLITWFAREAEKSDLKSGILLTILVVDIIGASVAFWGQTTSIMNDWGWSLVTIWILLAVGFGYFRLNEKY